MFIRIEKKYCICICLLHYSITLPYFSVGNTWAMSYELGSLSSKLLCMNLTVRKVDIWIIKKNKWYKKTIYWWSIIYNIIWCITRKYYYLHMYTSPLADLMVMIVIVIYTLKHIYTQIHTRTYTHTHTHTHTNTRICTQSDRMSWFDAPVYYSKT